MKEFVTLRIKRSYDGKRCEVYQKGSVIYSTTDETYLVIETVLNHMEQQRWNFVQMVGDQHLYDLILTFVR